MMDSGDVIADLIDFMLGANSPRALNELAPRISMGGTVPPPFQPLYKMVSLLICNTYTFEMDIEKRLPTHAVFPPLSEHEHIKTYFLSEEAFNMLCKTEYLEKCIFDSKFEDVD
mgnify:CR=1 FL=1